MTDIGEMVNVEVLMEEGDKKCEYKPDDKKWKCNLVGSSEALASLMEARDNKPKPSASSRAQLSSDNWPSQAHHIIPHKTLIAHAIKKWLTDADGGFIYAPTNYNVDHPNNGKWMPFASSLPEWEPASPQEKRNIMFEVMRKSGIQLHQGPHSKLNTYGIAKWPYKDRVDQYLKKIQTKAISHYAGPNACKDCKGKKQDGKYPPRENSVTYVDKASSCLNKEINQRLIFVSRIAAEFAQAGGFNP